jgi:hypothetical protein
MGLPPIDYGDEHFIQVNLQTLANAATAKPNEPAQPNQS